ncbi:M20 family metallopeptidase [Sporolactobacillus kofuensis]|uniref:Probable succinyl-diaminopimelate desuccinylase n=1 Tax=Sporolactobacillus kofuensis TaxID=269672 RepID=A0ABW1WEA8_9BACL|nr:ArgE/DapE family deacylase [Sporolactobacillus kofuensis]MCO7174859.1 ArgE/DapE family deacylase [Sporolactobacillus kofuensis]
MKSEAKDQLIQKLLSRKEELIELCSNLLKINSENPEGDSTEITQFIDEYLKEAGLETKIYEAAPKRFNLISEIKGEGNKRMILCGHTDTVPAGDRSKWSFDPFSGEVKDGYLLGRGASDMKGGVAGIVFAMAFLKKEGISLPGNLTLALVPDEECGDIYGVPWLLKNNHLSADGALIAEPASPLNPTIGQKGSCCFKVTVYGKPGHGSLAPFAGRSAIVDCMRAIKEVQTVTDLEIKIPEDVLPLIDLSNEYIRGSGMKGYDKVLKKITCNVGTIKGGTSSNVVADKCEVQFDCRLPFGTTQEEVYDYVKTKLNQLGIDYSIERFGFRSNANYTPAEDPICKSVVDNISYVKNDHGYGVLQWACSDARHFREYNIPVLQYGPAETETIHGFDERVKVQDVVDCALVYVLAALDFLQA